MAVNLRTRCIVHPVLGSTGNVAGKSAFCYPWYQSRVHTSVDTEWMAAMRRGDFAQAWAISDAVLASRDPAEQDNPRLPYHQRWVWDGRDFRGQHVLVRCYHGLGDTIQFARYLAALRPLVASLSVELQPVLLPLFATVRGPDQLIPFVLDAPSPPSACDIEIMELPYALRLPPQAAPPPPYLRVAPAAIGRGAVGICWQSGAWDTERDLPEDQALAACCSEYAARYSRCSPAPHRCRCGIPAVLPWTSWRRRR